jgi:hypothetical protein
MNIKDYDVLIKAASSKRMLSKTFNKVKLNWRPDYSRHHIPGRIHHEENCPVADVAVLSERKSAGEADQRTNLNGR